MVKKNVSKAKPKAKSPIKYKTPMEAAKAAEQQDNQGPTATE